jgi:ribosome-associated toxin RatA of RatAB toxin-antitoxin module
MHTENLTFIHGSIDTVFELAANVQNWPSLLPHYRFVDVLEQSVDGTRKVVRMSAVRDDFPTPGARFPVTWRSVQVCDPGERRIYFKHIGGVATGMWVVWELTPDPWDRGVRVTIRHDLRYPFAFMNGWFAGSVVGDGFVSAIAGQTLARFKEIVESSERDPG